MSYRVAEILARHASETFIGRKDELARLLSALEDNSLVVFIHGIAGVGKSALLAAFVEQARSRGATVLRLDCRAMEPTERGFLQELGAATGGAFATPEQAAERLGALGDRVVLALDTYEVFRLVDPWLRQVFIPLLTDKVRVILVGRDRPVSAWFISHGWAGLLRTVALDPLSEPEAIELLMQKGVGTAQARQINGFAHGHPLALKLAASVIKGWSQPDPSPAPPGFQAVVEELTRTYLADVRDQLTRQALDAASVVRRVTLSLLRAMLPGTAPQDAFERLRALPFVEDERDGLHLHELVRQAIAASLQAADPSSYQNYRYAAWRQLSTEIGKAGQPQFWRYTADLLFLIENPAVREAFFPTGGHHYIVEPASATDGTEIEEIIRRHESPPAAELLAMWWRQLPQSFRVVRDQDRTVAGFYCMFDSAAQRSTDLRDDPIVQEWRNHLRNKPVLKKERVLFLRRWLSREEGETPSPAQAACWLDIKRSYLELRPHLRRVYLTLHDLSPYAHVAQTLGFQQTSLTGTKIDDCEYYTALLDFGPSSVDGWLSDLVRAELGVKEEEILDLEAGELVLDGRRVKLTSLELSLFSYLYQRDGKVVTRAALIEDVWRSKHTGSNVIEAVIRSLRKKLRDSPLKIETIRGMGYRFRKPSA